ncbi:MAG: serine/threonine protein kinase [Phycisphaerae bacterium]|nr:serine/threonine protein kinase [Phycisphaerae bacterium]
MATASGTLQVPGYRIVQLLGNGARSTIWQVRHISTGKFYALKRVVKRERSDFRFIEQVETEYANSHKLNHPNLRKVHNLKRIRRWLAISEIQLMMEYCSGETIQNARPQSIPRIVEIFSTVASVLDHMNSRGIIHADTKPNNILIGDDGEIKVIDLGHSCDVGTVKDRIQGTPDFIAPEQVQRRPLDYRTDIFNFGASLYWTLTGRAIPSALPQTDSIRMKREHVLHPIAELNPGVPQALIKLVEDCIEPIPANRHGSMKDIISRLGLVTLTLNRKAPDDTAAGDG